jgi:sugar phosphate isomerase/epimerase
MTKTVEAFMIEKIIRSVQVCIPFKLLKEEYLPMVLEKRINPEIGISGDVIDTHSERAFHQMARLIQKEGLTITLHGPFFDLVPGGMDKRILQASRERLKQAFDLIPLFNPLSIVCHTGYDRKRYIDDQDQWLETAMETWTQLLQSLEGSETILMFENVYEKTPNMLLRLIKGLDSERVGFCFDAGHMNVFSKTDLDGWLTAMTPFLKQLHLHDNEGDRDDHLAIGAGKINFDRLFSHIERKQLKPIITLEAHQEQALWTSLETLSRSDQFCRIVQSP